MTSNALVGTCKGGPKDGLMHATLNQSRRLALEGGAYVYKPDPKGHHVGQWLWLPEKKDAGK